MYRNKTKQKKLKREKVWRNRAMNKDATEEKSITQPVEIIEAPEIAVSTQEVTSSDVSPVQLKNSPDNWQKKFDAISQALSYTRKQDRTPL